MPDTAAADLLFRPVDELAGLVRDGALGARELVQASLDRIDELNPQVNAFVDVFGDEALAAADAIGPGDERPFAGVPIAIKNNRAVEGKRLTFAADFFGDFAAPYDHNVTRRLKAAGFIVVGTTTLPEYGILPVTETRRFGATRNPWDTGPHARRLVRRLGRGRRLRGWCRSRTPTTAAARSASRPPAAGSSASSPSAAGSRWPRRRAGCSSSPTAC